MDKNCVLCGKDCVLIGVDSTDIDERWWSNKEKEKIVQGIIKVLEEKIYLLWKDLLEIEYLIENKIPDK